jgi:hypothetical protein
MLYVTVEREESDVDRGAFERLWTHGASLLVAGHGLKVLDD